MSGTLVRGRASPRASDARSGMSAKGSSGVDVRAAGDAAGGEKVANGSSGAAGGAGAGWASAWRATAGAWRGAPGEGVASRRGTRSVGARAQDDERVGSPRGGTGSDPLSTFETGAPPWVRRRSVGKGSNPPPAGEAGVSSGAPGGRASGPLTVILVPQRQVRE